MESRGLRMNIKNIFFTLIMMGSISQAYAHPQIVFNEDLLNDTLCQDSEDIYFNAQLENGKLASLCGYQHYSPDTGYVKYRYGELNNIELEYPNDKKPPRGQFLTYHIRLNPNLQGHWIYFYINDDLYLISSFNNECLVSIDDASSMKRKKIFLEYCDKQSSLKNFGLPSGLFIGEEKIYKKFPEQFQDPSEPQFHKSSWIHDYK